MSLLSVFLLVADVVLSAELQTLFHCFRPPTASSVQPKVSMAPHLHFLEPR
jgi:hypothetical protein